MRLGQTINGYRVTTKPSNANAGKCLWAFAEKDGGEYFIKEFLDPKIPRPDSMGTVQDKQLRWAECERFAARHSGVMERLRPDDPLAGNLILALDFFAEGTRYYKVTRRVRAVEADPADLNDHGKLVLLRTLAESLHMLHRCGIVHGDLKPDNVLLARPRPGALLIAKLIDFDDAFPAGEPPPGDVIGGNPVYGSPEWLRHLRGDPGNDPRSLTQASDVFAFALLSHTYLMGRLPGHGTEHDSAAAAVLARSRLDWHPRLSERLRLLFTELTAVEPRQRPAMDRVIAILDADDVLTSGDPEPETLGGHDTGRVRFNFSPTPRARTSPGRLRVNMTSTE